MNTTNNAVRKYFKTTTLHGFKYLLSRYYTDRIFWVVSCLASATCAGMLCSALWVRFLHLPALLALRDIPEEFSEFQPIPTVTVCQPLFSTARKYLSTYAPEHVNVKRLAGTFSRAMRGEPTNVTEVNFVEHLIRVNHYNLLELLFAFTPTCTKLITKCRWQGVPVPPELVFTKKLTHEGVCCVVDPSRLMKVQVPAVLNLGTMKKLDMVLDCSNGTISHGCTMYTEYRGEDWIVPKRLAPGYTYYGELSFIHEKDNDDQNLVSSACVSTEGYSQRECLLSCAEKRCGCSGPFWSKHQEDKELYVCSLKKIRCLRIYSMKVNSTCECLPPCNKVITRLIMEQSRIASHMTLDPLNSELNSTRSVVMRLRIDIYHSKIFTLIPTETWLTLLSSLGGVFNMFLGVGLFSALELLFFFFVKLPKSFKQF